MKLIKLIVLLSFGIFLPTLGQNVLVKHLISERNIVRLSSQAKYLLLPIQDNAPDAQLNVIVNNHAVLGQPINVRLARERVDYFVPLDISAYDVQKMAVDIQGMPSNAVCWKEIKLSDSFDMNNTEQFRPVYHHTPAYGWMNDPNGMFYKDGVYHLYFQHNPYGSTWGNMTWGHSVSKDLVNWDFQGDVIFPDEWGAIFSGSCIVDYQNMAGFGKGAVIAFYTSAKTTRWGDVQSQSLAYSLDNGKTFVKYEKNPILTSVERDFRDPKVFWYAPGKHWVMILAAGQEMQIYSSLNLKEWKKESSFGRIQGAHGGVWECPDLIELKVEGSGKKKWVLLCNINPGGPFGGSATQYFVGSFDGKTFVNESPTLTKWMDWGKDNYATVTWSNAPQGRTIALGWMSNWQYQHLLPTRQFRGTNTIARDLALYQEGGTYYLSSVPSPELDLFRKDRISIPAFESNSIKEITPLLPDNGGAYEIETVVEKGSAGKIFFDLKNDKGEKVSVWFDFLLKQVVFDRRESGLVSFNQDFPSITAAPMGDRKEIHLRIFIDKSSIEIFSADGHFVMTNCVFPSEPYNCLTIGSDVGKYRVKKLSIFNLAK